MLIGTPEYTSPEQAKMGGLDIDSLTDIYALGAAPYGRLVDSLPIDGKCLRQGGLAQIVGMRETCAG